MSWQLWVVIALAAIGLVLLVVARMRHARRVFDDITRLDRPAEGAQADDLSEVRARRLDPGARRNEQSNPRRKHG